MYDNSLINDFITYKTKTSGRKMSKNSGEQYLDNLNKMANFINTNYQYGFNEQEINNLKIQHIFSYLTYLSDKNLADTSRATHISQMKTFFVFLFKILEVIQIDIASKIEVPKIKRKEPRALGASSASKFIQSFKNPRDKAIVSMLINTGMRLFELLNLNIQDVSDDKVIIIGKGNKERNVFFNSATKKTLEEYLKVRKSTNEALFVNEKGERLAKRYIQKIVSDKAKKMGFSDITVHKLRATFASLLLAQGENVANIQKLLGHSSIVTTTYYMKTQTDIQQEAVMKLNIE